MSGSDRGMPSFRMLHRLAVFFWISCFFVTGAAAAPGSAVLKGTVSDVDGRPVQGARVFAYDSPEVRRSADFISAPTDANGRFRLVLTAGTFWTVARLKKGEEYGPLMPGDKHSGEPEEIELPSGGEITQNFIVADLKEAIRKRTKEREGPVKISGRIVDEQGAPVQGAYAFANRRRAVSGFPDFISPWVDGKGRFTLYVPRGKYYLGAARSFPPEQSSTFQGEMDIEHDISAVEIVTRGTGTR